MLSPSSYPVSMQPSLKQMKAKASWQFLIQILWHTDLLLSSKMQHRLLTNQTTFTIPISKMLGRTSIFQSEADLSWIVEACVNSRYTGADCNISSLPGRLASINRPIHQAAALPLTRVSGADGENKWWRGGINQRTGGRHLPPDWPSQAQRWSMMEGLGSVAGRLFVWRSLVKC